MLFRSTDDPADSLQHHEAIRRSPGKLKARVYPAFRPDKALGVGNPAAFNAWLERLAGVEQLFRQLFAGA